ncbi:MAG: hypothetical protein ABSA49_19480 [Rhizomicrobium sp.]|jgi:uncharacterized membrane protein
MADINATRTPVGDASTLENLRLFSIVVYALFIAAFCNGVAALSFTALIGVIIAYVKRDDARGTIYESHFTNAIEVFWITLVIELIAIPLYFLFLLGALIHVGLIVWYLYRSIKGLIRAIDAQPYR